MGPHWRQDETNWEAKIQESLRGRQEKQKPHERGRPVGYGHHNPSSKTTKNETIEEIRTVQKPGPFPSNVKP
ncbi:hypothetical protein MA16_Dca028592 [Dendrobium catenatum]|uniref:Uncharacterized protein n=1 Tax=Dendrobium catenatum TaxID=906689 RepID=A0A2I0V8L0_9ASPA|nr:hypothetical protein MA16_Dca028592 [Dendrobium catenatum]